MKLVLAHFKANALELLRLPAYWVPSMVFPAMFFLFFAAPNAETAQAANTMLGSYLIFAVLGVVMFQFGVGVANDRVLPWNTYLRTLPLLALTLMSARILTALLFALLAGGVLVIAAYLSTPVNLSLATWSKIAVGIVAGAIPLSFLGMAIGYWAAPKAALPIANLLYLPLSFLGGLWIPPQFLPEFVQKLSPFTPTRQWGEVVWPAIAGLGWKPEAWLWLLGFALLFGTLAAWGYRRDEGQRFS